MTDVVTAPPAGWYTDPGGSGGTRWWDGVQWTTYVQAPEPAPRPAPEPEPAVATIEPDPLPHPIASSTPTTAAPSEQERLAYYRNAQAAQASHTVSAFAPSAVAFGGASGSAPAQPGYSPLAFGAGEPARGRYEPDPLQQAKNSAGTSAIVLAGFNVAWMIVAFFYGAGGIFRIVPAVIGIVLSIGGIRQARVAAVGMGRSVAALVIHIVVALVGGAALVGAFVVGFMTGLTGQIAGVDDYALDLRIETAVMADAQNLIDQDVIAVDCPAGMVAEPSQLYFCTAHLADSSTLQVEVEFDADGSAYYTVPAGH